MTFDDLPQTLPIFPLDKCLLLPGGLLPLNIFEPCYLKMVDDALAGHRMIGVVQPDKDLREKGHKDAIYKTGCAGRITQFNETDDGRYLITLSGLNRFRIAEEISTVLAYRQVKPNWNAFPDDMVEDCESLHIDRDAMMPLLERYFALFDMSCDWDIMRGAPCNTLMATLPMICPFTSQEKQALLETVGLNDRYEKFMALLQMSLNESSGLTSSIKH